MSFRGLLVDLTPNSPSLQQTICMADSKENYSSDLGREGHTKMAAD